MEKEKRVKELLRFNFFCTADNILLCLESFIVLLCKNLFFYSALCKAEQVFSVSSPER